MKYESPAIESRQVIEALLWDGWPGGGGGHHGSV
jgi:hypothetical protein